MVQAPVKPPTQRLTDEEFRQFLREDDSDNLYELVDGWVQVMAEPGGGHEDVRTDLLLQMGPHIKAHRLPFKIRPRAICKLAQGNQRRPDLIVVANSVWERNTRSEVILEEPPELVIEIVSTNWEDDYIKKPLWYAAFGVKEYWIADLLLKIDQYPTRKNPEIKEPTLSIGTLVNGAYQWQRFTGDRRIESRLFPELELTVEMLVQGIS